MSRRLVLSAFGGARIDAVLGWLPRRSGEVLLVAPSRGAADDLLEILNTTLVGSIDILAINLKNNGTIKVDDADDSLRIGESPSAVDV